MDQNRTPAGVPSGGQFAAGTHAEGTVVLDETSVVTLHFASDTAVADAGTEATLAGSIYHPEHTVTVGVLDDRSQFAFRAGQCHALAFALHERTRWPVYAVGQKECCLDEDCPEVDDSDGVCSCQFEHLVVQRPDGDFVDIDGARPGEDLLEASSDPDYNEIRPVPDDRLLMLMRGGDGWREPDMAVARGFVDPVLDEADR